MHGARRAREGLLMRQKGARRLSELAQDDVNAGDAIRAVIEGARLERLARGEPTEHIRNTEDRDPQLERLNDEELERLIRNFAEVGAGKGGKPPNDFGGDDWKLIELLDRYQDHFSPYIVARIAKLRDEGT